MIKNREQLLALSADWSARAKNDLRNKMIEFIEMSGMNQAQLSDVLGMSMGEIEQILNGNGEITLTTFAKLLIATDHVLEIKPLAMSPLAQGMPRKRANGRTEQPRDANGRFMPRHQGGMPQFGQEIVDGYPSPSRMRNGEMPFVPPTDENGNILPPPMDENGNILPPPPMFNGQMPRFGGMPGVMPRIRRNQMPQVHQHQVAQPQPQREATNSLDALDRRSLVNIIRENNWDGELDLINSTRSEMIDFITSKQQVPHQVGTDVESERIAQMLAEEMERNPHLRETIQKYL